MKQPPGTLGCPTLTSLYVSELCGKRVGEWDSAGCHPMNVGPQKPYVWPRKPQPLFGVYKVEYSIPTSCSTTGRQLWSLGPQATL